MGDEVEEVRPAVPAGQLEAEEEEEPEDNRLQVVDPEPEPDLEAAEEEEPGEDRLLEADPDPELVLARQSGRGAPDIRTQTPCKYCMFQVCLNSFSFPYSVTINS